MLTRGVLVIGAGGQVGRELRRAAWPAGWRVTFLDRAAADLGAPHALGPLVGSHRPDVVIIAAAYTAVDRAEAEEALAETVNCHAPGAIARAAAEVGAAVIHLSTDYVFDGRKPGAYVETDAARPLNAYGRSKLAGEIEVRAANPRHLILRTSWVYSAHGSNFLRTMMTLAATRDEVHVVDDQIACPTSAADIAAAIVRLCGAPGRSGTRFGTYHLAGSSAVSRHGFAEEILRLLARHGASRPCNVAIPSSRYAAPATRPSNSRLDCSLIASTFGLRLPGLEQSLPGVVAEAMGRGS